MKSELLILAIAPTIACMLWIYLKDKYEKEPIMVLGKFFIMGAFVSVIGIIVEGYLMKINIFYGYSNILYTSFIVAGLTEEGLKALVLIPNLLNEKNFNEKLDGMIYSMFLSLGFASVENIIYVIFEETSFVFQVGLSRAIISVPTHVMFAITMGYYISKYKFSRAKIKKREYLIMAILAPILLHGTFDFMLMIGYRWAIILFIIYVIFIWKINLDNLDEYTHKSKVRFFKLKKRRNSR